MFFSQLFCSELPWEKESAYLQILQEELALSISKHYLSNHHVLMLLYFWGKLVNKPPMHTGRVQEGTP